MKKVSSHQHIQSGQEYIISSLALAKESFQGPYSLSRTPTQLKQLHIALAHRIIWLEQERRAHFHADLLRAIKPDYLRWCAEDHNHALFTEEEICEVMRLFEVYFELSGLGRYSAWDGEYPLLCRLKKADGDDLPVDPYQCSA